MNVFPGNSGIIVLALLLGALQFCIIIWLISRTTGWSMLARQYPYETKYSGPVWRFQTVYMRYGGKYSGIVTIGADAEGLYFALIPIFNIGHRPFRVPWHEMQFELKRHWAHGEYLEIHFPKVPGTVMRIPARVVKKIAQVVGPQLSVAADNRLKLAQNEP